MEIISEGKSRQVRSTDVENEVLVEHKDQASAYNGIKRAMVPGKGIMVNKISSILYQALEKAGVETHFIRMVDERQQLCRKVQPIRLEFIVRNYAAGDMTNRLNIELGTKLPSPVYEICYKDDNLDDPIINESYVTALGISTAEELDIINKKLVLTNDVLTDLFSKVGIVLVDFKVEFGRAEDGRLLMCDELSPDSCRLWDATTMDSLDRDRFRYDLGKVGEAYEDVYNRLNSIK